MVMNYHVPNWPLTTLESLDIFSIKKMLLNLLRVNLKSKKQSITLSIDYGFDTLFKDY